MPFPPSTLQESRRMRAVQAPIIPTVSRWISSRPDTLSLAQGVVFYPPPPAAIAAAEAFLCSGRHHYGPVEGEPGLRLVIREKLRSDNDIDLGDDERRILVTAGGNMAFLNAMFAICDAGDEVILPLPYYFNHEMAIRMVGAEPVPVPTTAAYQLDLDALRRAVTPRTRAIVTVSPNNPSGMVYPARDLAIVNALCRDAGIYHVSDEAYEHFTYGAASHFSPASLPDASEHTISLYSLSKSFGFAAWRIGYMVSPAHLWHALLKVQDTNLICANLAAQHAAAAALNSSPAYRLERLRALARVRETVIAELAPLGPGCRVSGSEGAFYFLLQIDADVDALELVEALINEHGVAVLPGSAFGIERGCCLRVSYGALEPDNAIAGIKRLGAALCAIIRI